MLEKILAVPATLSKPLATKIFRDNIGYPLASVFYIEVNGGNGSRDIKVTQYNSLTVFFVLVILRMLPVCMKVISDILCATQTKLCDLRGI